MKLVPLSRGMFAKVDDEDYERVAARKWHAAPVVTKSRIIWYAHSSTSRTLGPQRQIRMHRFILGANGRAPVDHYDDDGLNNQRFNLRVVTTSQNGSRRRKQLGLSSTYKGVSWRTAMGKWGASIKLNGKQKQLGYFADEHDAATVYNFAAVELFGEFTRLNTPIDRDR